jgi:hypothetical protein
MTVKIVMNETPCFLNPQVFSCCSFAFALYQVCVDVVSAELR